jgi:hypothetical protein
MWRAGDGLDSWVKPVERSLSIGKKRKRIERLGVDPLRSLEDEEMAAALDFVQRAGWTVRSNQEALELYRRHAAERAPPRARDR